MHPFKAKGEFSIYIQLQVQSPVNTAEPNLWHTACVSSTSAQVSHLAPGICLRLAAVMMILQKQENIGAARVVWQREIEAEEGGSEDTSGIHAGLI